MRACSKCKEEKELTEFYKCKAVAKDGIDRYCKTCRKGFTNSYRRKHPEGYTLYNQYGRYFNQLMKEESNEQI